MNSIFRLIFALFTILVTFLSADSQLVLKENQENSVLIRNVDESGIDVQIEISSIELQAISRDEGDFLQVVVPGLKPSHEIGYPQLPMVSELIEIPLGDLEFEIQEVSLEEKEIDLDSVGYHLPLYPSQPPVSKDLRPEEVPFVFNQEAYSRDKYYGTEEGRVKIIGVLRNTRIGLLTYYPVRYNPVKNKLIVRTMVKFRVQINNADQELTRLMKRQYYSPYFDPVLCQLPNYTIPENRDDLTRYPVKYVIVADPIFESTLQPFIDWKREKGFTVIEAYTDDPEVGNSTTSIQSYLHSLYNQGTADDPAPSFVLLVGDIAQIPPFNGQQGSHVTDLYYCTVTNDMLPDMYYGRFSAESINDLIPQIDKTLAMEMYTVPDNSFMGRAMLIAGWDSYHTTDWGWPQVNYGTENYFNASYNFTEVYPYLTTGSHQYEQEIVNNASGGLTFINYTAHGSETSWADPSFTISDINSLNNTDMYPTVVGNCCLTNAFDYYSPCFGEAWLRAENKGAVGYIGGTNSTYWDEDLWWAVGFHTIQHGQGGAAPPYDQTGMGAFDGNFVFDYNTQGAMVVAGNLAVEESGSSGRNYYWEIYTLMGDPSFMTYMGIPQENEVSLPDFVPVGVDYMVLDAEPGSYIAVSQDGVLHAAYFKESEGPITLDIEPFQSPGTATVVITAQNRIPVIQEIPVIVPAVVDISPAELVVNQPDTITVHVFESDGTTPLEGVQVWLEGWGVDSETAQGVTNPVGTVDIPVTPPFGEILVIQGKQAQDDYFLFTDSIPVVGGIDFESAEITASVPELGLQDQLTPFYNGYLTGECSEEGFSIHARGCGLDTSSVTDTLVVVPNTLGVLEAAITKSGYNVYSERFDVVPVYGDLTLTIFDQSQNVIPEVSVKVYQLPDTFNVYYEGSTGSDGEIQLDDLQVGYYLFKIQEYGYLPLSEVHFIAAGDNQLDFVLTDAPYSTIHGMVTSEVDGQGIPALIRLYRIEEYGRIFVIETEADQNGDYQLEVPYYQYLIKASYPGYLPEQLLLNVHQDDITVDFILSTSIGNILIVDDNFSSTREEEVKSAFEISQILTNAGFYTEIESSEETDPQSWSLYDLVISSSGGNPQPLSNSFYRSSLEGYVNNGGKLLIEGGNVGYMALQYPEYAGIRDNVLHINYWNDHEAGNLIKQDYDHPLCNFPNLLPAVMVLNYQEAGDQDACRPSGGSYLVYKTEEYGNSGGVIVYDDNDNPQSAQTIFLTFNWQAINGDFIKRDLLQNCVTYLLNPEGEGNSVISGYVDLTNSENDQGVKVEVMGTIHTAYTDSSGYYQIDGLLPGIYTLQASREGYGYARIRNLQLGENDTLENQDFSLDPLFPLLVDNFECGLNQWTTTDGWGLTEQEAHSGEHSITDSPEGNYPASSVSYLTIAEPLQFSGCSSAFLHFWHKYELGDGDFASVEVSSNGTNWIELRRFEGSAEEWQEVWVDLTGQTCYTTLFVRFKLSADSYSNGDGWYLDDLFLLSNGGNTYSAGDLNADGEVNVLDVVRVVNIILNLPPPPTASEFWAGDLNQDGELNVMDVIKIVQRILSPGILARGNLAPASRITLRLQNDLLSYETDGAIAALELEVSATSVQENLLKTGLHFAMNPAGNHLIYYTLGDGLLQDLKGDLLRFSSLPVKIEKTLVVNAEGKVIPVEVQSCPQEYRFHQNFPNPFNSRTSIRFEIPRDTHVKIEVFNLKGELVKVLINGDYKAGSHRVMWNGKLDDGSEATSGVYLCRLKAGSYSQVIKMVLIK